ncbi:ABC transporter substrate-binding protein [Paenibacillus sp. LHD-38]|uniref:ABC transporter substrate-binding protein n=1 Tax=Paenibacillus sp. LHD-38 TaxID=3072143 RepID=UPI00280E3D4A|nr:ABC transporter substrate-binding protein [Paenibacillus sp. LHD-38]MDQ8734271.1 ABC transporter substrate-binding protein [Paenibacillus sp. LHD-38]
MKKKRKVITLLAMVALLVSACSGGNGGSNKGENDSKETEKNVKPVEIVYAYPVFGNIPADMQRIEDEVNKISIKEINVKAKLLPISGGNWGQQINLMVTSGEKLDVMPTLGNFNNMVAQKQLLDMTDLMDSLGQGITSAVGDNFLKGTKVDGKVYGVTVGNGKAAVPNIAMRKDILDKYGLSIDSVNTIDDIAKIYEVISEKEPQMAMLIPNGIGNVTLSPASLLFQSTYDNLGDGLGVLLGNDNHKVVNLFETEEYTSILKTMNDWYQKGYILKDAATSNESAVNLLKAGKGFSEFTNGEVGLDAQLARNTGHPFVTKKLQDPLITSGIIQGLTWVIPVTSKNPEAAMKFLNLTYTNADVVNLIDWGIEGMHYEKKQDGTIGYPSGVNASNTGYAFGQDWLMGNQLIAHVWDGNDPNNYNILEENNKTAPISIALGFSYDSSKVKTEIANVNNVIDQYRPGLDTGSLDPDKYLPEFNAKLKAAGLDKIIAEKQKQLDAWFAANEK